MPVFCTRLESIDCRLEFEAELPERCMVVGRCWVPEVGVRLEGAEEPERTGVGFVDGELDFEDDPDGAIGRVELGLGVAERVGDDGRVVDLEELEELLLLLDEDEPLVGRDEELRVAVPDLELLEELLLPLDDEVPRAGRDEELRVAVPDLELLEELLLPLEDDDPRVERDEELRVLLPDLELLDDPPRLLEEDDGRDEPLELPRLDEEDERLLGRAELLRCRFSWDSKLDSVVETPTEPSSAATASADTNIVNEKIIENTLPPTVTMTPPDASDRTLFNPIHNRQ